MLSEGPLSSVPSGRASPVDALAGQDRPILSIGDLAGRTGLTPTALRMWEQRYGFPVPHRLAGGHRRYTAYDVRLVRQVLDRREAGVRMEQAVRQVLAAASPTSPSVFATLRAGHPSLEAHRMRKSTLLAMSWAIEDQVAALAAPVSMWGAFQRREFYRPASARWRGLAATASAVTVLADFASSDATTYPRQVALGSEAPMRREWAVVVDGSDLPVALSAWELPGQDEVPDRSRVFEAVWTLRPTAVRDAARVCASVARSADPALVDGRFGVPPPLEPHECHEPSLDRATALFSRMTVYLDRFAPTDRHVATPPLLSASDHGHGEAAVG